MSPHDTSGPFLLEEAKFLLGCPVRVDKTPPPRRDRKDANDIIDPLDLEVFQVIWLTFMLMQTLMSFTFILWLSNSETIPLHWSWWREWRPPYKEVFGTITISYLNSYSAWIDEGVRYGPAQYPTLLQLPAKLTRLTPEDL